MKTDANNNPVAGEIQWQLNSTMGTSYEYNRLFLGSIVQDTGRCRPLSCHFQRVSAHGREQVHPCLRIAPASPSRRRPPLPAHRQQRAPSNAAQKHRPEAVIARVHHRQRPDTAQDHAHGSANTNPTS